MLIISVESTIECVFITRDLLVYQFIIKLLSSIVSIFCEQNHALRVGFLALISGSALVILEAPNHGMSQRLSVKVIVDG